MKTELPASDIQALVESKIGSVSHFDPLPEGLASQTYAFRQGTARYVVRVGRSSWGYDKDAFAWRTFASAALPIPEIVSIDTFGEVAVCISRRAPGVRLCDVGGDAAILTPRIINLLAELGRTDPATTVGFGAFDATGEAPFKSWRDYLLQVSSESFCNWSLIKDRSDRRRVDAAILAVERLAPVDPPRRALIHGDFGAANLLSDGRVITAVIDWDRALAGDAAYDQANLFFWREAGLQPVLARLAADHAGDADWARRVLCYQLRICLQELSEGFARWQPIDAGWLFARCAELIDLARDLS